MDFFLIKKNISGKHVKRQSKQNQMTPFINFDGRTTVIHVNICAEHITNIERVYFCRPICMQPVESAQPHHTSLVPSGSLRHIFSNTMQGTFLTKMLEPAHDEKND